MKKILFLLALVGPMAVFSQVKVGANPEIIDPGSIMELESTNKALVLTRLNNEQMANLNPLNGALVYNVDTSCLHYHTGNQWVNLCELSSGISFTNNGDGTVTLVDGQDNEITFNGAEETITTLTDNLNSTYTYTNEAGDQTQITTNDFDGEWASLSNIPPDIVDGDDNTVTSLTQDNVTGLITYTNESMVNQTAEVVSADANNEIIPGSNGGAFYQSPIKAFGKIAGDGTSVRVTPGVTVTKLAGAGHYRVNLPIGLVVDADYIIQIAQPSREGTGNDDPSISYLNQTNAGFEVIIGDNDNGGTDTGRFDSEFMFTIFDL
ncbi:hypothetical protein GTQ34_11105 [Muricauda sp. JGD-17]|uniref:Uncharacterized protein n=1 Tax=Flagellimonas ochracea TaxID=2696472 RepID=A0A964WYD6_9FLAO|nr:hypothetical protein [Allomuricauda ochracea]NAY92469.1 hypothetical protein [Allomuricauda ochracea]